MIFSEKQQAGAKSLLQNGLHLTADDTLLVLHQLEFENAANCIQQVAVELGLKTILKQFSKEIFCRSTPQYLISAIPTQHATPKAIILLMEWSEETTATRLELLKILTNDTEKWRIASMPGVNLENFDLCICDLQEISSISLNIFSILARSKKVIIKSRNPYNSYDKLTIPIKGYNPIKSTGEISPGSWGNFPSGETFIVPDEYRAFGWITIQGSFPNYSMKQNEWIRIEIRRGRMIGKSITASSGELKVIFMKLFFTSTGRAKSKNMNTLAELGIGTNKNIKHLTGNPIFDEKKAGTIHIAFGRNTQFGGPIIATAHHDVTCDGVEVKVNKLTLIDSKEIILTNDQATPQLYSFKPKKFNSSIEFIGGNVTYKYSDTSKKLLIQYMSRNEEVQFTVAEGELAKEANEILEKAKKRLCKFEEISNQSKNLQMTTKLLNGMLAYNLIEIKK